MQRINILGIGTYSDSNLLRKKLDIRDKFDFCDSEIVFHSSYSDITFFRENKNNHFILVANKASDIEKLSDDMFDMIFLESNFDNREQFLFCLNLFLHY